MDSSPAEDVDSPLTTRKGPLRIGIIIQLSGTTGESGLATRSWNQVRDEVVAAERVGFDSAVYEDVLWYPGEDKGSGVWESVAISGALAEATSKIRFGPSVFNGVYRSPTLLAKVAETLDEISEGRFILGIGAGNTPDDYPPFGFPSDFRFSRFAEAIEIIHSMLKTGSASLDGRFWRANDAQMVLRGPRSQGPPIVMAAGGPKMLRLAARFADEWNWWPQGEDPHQAIAPLIEELDSACAEEDRDPSNLLRSLDIYSVDPLGLGTAGHPVAIGGSHQEITNTLAGLGSLGVTEVRCNLVYDKEANNKIEAIESMADIVEAVQAR